MRDFPLSTGRAPLPRHRTDSEVLAESEGLSLRDYWQVIQRRRWLILVFCVVIVLITAVTIVMLPPVYTAETTLLMERNAPRVLDFHEVQTDQSILDEYDFYKTQFEVLKSRALAAWVIQEQGLEANPLFTGVGKQGPVTWVKAHVQGWVAQWAWGRKIFSPSGPVPSKDHLGSKPALLKTYLAMLDIKPIQRTRLVKIMFHTSDPELSARLANAHAQAYIRQGLRLRLQANEDAQHFLQNKLVELKGRLEQSEASLKEYRRTKKVIAPDEKDNLVVTRLSALSKQLTETEAERIGLEAQLATLRQGDYEALPAITARPTIQTLKQQLAQREGELSQMVTVYKPGHPQLEAAQAQVENIQRKLHEEIRQTVHGLESTYSTALIRERALQDKVEAQRAEVLSLKDAAGQYAILTREVDTNRQLYDSVLQRLKEAGVVSELRVSNVSIIDHAQAPLSASTPYKKALFLSVLVGCLGGVGLALLLDYLDHTFKTPQEIEHALRLPSLGIVPDFSRLHERPRLIRKLTSILPKALTAQQRDEKCVRLPSHALYTVVTEAYRTLRTSILLSQAGEPPQTILFTSSNHGDGKTVSVINTAIVFAQTGARVLVIDADLRRPHCHRKLGIENGRGLTEVLTGQRAPGEAISPTTLRQLSLLRAGSSPPDPAELIGSRKMQELLAALRKSYDFILIDSPPVVPVSDAVLVATLVDGVVLVISRQTTSRQVAKETRARLEYARARILGVLFNRAELPSTDGAYYS